MAKIIKNINVGRKALESEELPYNWEDLDINNMSFPQGKVMLFFGGNTTNRAESANGNIKLIKAVVSPENEKKTSFYSFSYNTEPIKSQGYISAEYEEEIKLFYEKTIKPLLVDKSGNVKEQKGIETVFNKLIFGAHCGGSAFVNVIINQICDTLSQKYPDPAVEMLVSKIQYFAYAPSEMLSHNVNSLQITPFYDPSFSFIKAIDVAQTSKVDIDYPRGVVKRLLKARQHGLLKEAFEAEFEDVRAVMFRVGNSTFYIPSQLNKHTHIGDHTIECMAKPQFINSGTDLAKNAKLVNYASKVFINEALSSKPVDVREMFSTVSSKVSSLPAGPEKEC